MCVWASKCIALVLDDSNSRVMGAKYYDGGLRHNNMHKCSVNAMYARTFSRLVTAARRSSSHTVADHPRDRSAETAVAAGTPSLRFRPVPPTQLCSASSCCGCPWPPRRYVTGVVVKSPRAAPSPRPIPRCRLKSAATCCSNARPRRYGRTVIVLLSYGGPKT